MRESVVEKKCVEIVREYGGQMLKWVSPGTRSVPDRIVLIPRCPVLFVELKAPTGRLSPGQGYLTRWLTQSGFEAITIDDSEKFEEFIHRWVAKHA